VRSIKEGNPCGGWVERGESLHNTTAHHIDSKRKQYSNACTDLDRKKKAASVLGGWEGTSHCKLQLHII